MSISNSIRLTLNIKDKNISFDDNCVSKQLINNNLSLVYHGSLSYDTPSYCPKCGTLDSLIKHGFKLTRIKLPNVSEFSTFLNLKKQRFFCKSCNKSHCASTSLIPPRHSISSNTKTASIIHLKDKISIKDLSKRFNISHTTVNNWLNSLSNQFIVKKTFLPQNLCFDEFKSVKSVYYKMSFIFCDASSGKVVDIVQNRQLSHLKSYFFSFSDKARKRVKTVTIDMYSPYIELIKACFPKAKIIIDRFHIVAHLSRALNKTRVQVMNNNNTYYTKLKRYWKLLLKPNDSLDFKTHNYFTCFKPLMTESLVVSNLLKCDKVLHDTYYFYHEYTRALRNKQRKKCQKLINQDTKHLSQPMQKAIETLKKYDSYIMNSLSYPYSNGILEGTNNLIKVIKRIAFGFRSYDNFRARVLLCANTMVRLEQ